MRYGTAAQRAQNDWNTQLRRKVAKLEEKEQFRQEFQKFLEDNRLDCFKYWNFTTWEVKISSVSGNWFVFKENIEEDKAMLTAMVEAKSKIRR